MFWRISRFSPVAFTSFYLNLTPGIERPHVLDRPGEAPRIATVVEMLGNEQDNKSIFLANTHFPQGGAVNARKGVRTADLGFFTRFAISTLDLTTFSSSKFDGGGWLGNERIPGTGDILARTLSDIAGDAPLILTGDFNTTEIQRDYRVIRGEASSEYVSGFGLTDTFKAVNCPDEECDRDHVSTQTPDPDTERAFGDDLVTSGSRIDHILASSDFTTLYSEIVRRKFLVNWDYDSVLCWKYASDHYPVISLLDYATVANPGGGGSGGGEPPAFEPPDAPVLLPESAVLLLAGLGALGVAARRRKG